MKKYTIEEIIFKIKELDKESEKMTETIRELRNKRSSLKIMDFAGKNAIDQEIDTKSKMLNCFQYAKLMFLLYEDTMYKHTENKSPLSDEKLIQCERNAAAGDGFSKLISFCHRCFVDNAIIGRDIKRLEIEAEEGDLTSLYILWGYKTYFEE